MSINRKAILTAGLWALLEKWGNKLFGILTFIILARLLDANDFGTIAIVRLLLDYLELFVVQGLGYAIIQKKDLNSGHLDSAFWISLLISIFVSGGVYYYSDNIAAILGHPEISELIKWMSIGLVIAGLTRIQVALLTREMKFKELTLRGLIITLGGGIIGVILALKGYGVWSLVGQHLGGAILGVFILWFSSNWRPSFCISFKSLIDLYSFSINIFFDQQVIFLSQRIDEGLIAGLLGTNALGYYSIAKRMFFLISDLFLSVISKVAFSVISKNQNDKGLLKNGLISCTKLLSIIITPIFLGTSLLSPEIIVFAFGDKWLPASDTFSVLMTSGIFLIIPTLTHALYNGLGKPGLSLKLNVFRAILSILFIPYATHWGMIGIAVSIVLRNFIGSLIDCAFLRRYVSITMFQYYIITIRAIIMFIPTAVIVYWIASCLRQESNSYVIIVFSGTVGVLLHLVILRLFQKKLFNELLITLNLKSSIKC